MVDWEKLGKDTQEKKDKLWEDFIFSGVLTQAIIVMGILVVLAVFVGVVFIAPVAAPTNVAAKDLIVEYKKGYLLDESGERITISSPGGFVEYQKTPPATGGAFILEKEDLSPEDVEDLAAQFNRVGFRAFKSKYDAYGGGFEETTTITLRARGVSHTVISYDNSAPEEFFELEQAIRDVARQKIPKIP